MWPDAAAGRRDVEWTDELGSLMVRNVTVPSLTAYLPDPAMATGSAMIVAPGGGFFQLSVEHEGSAVAEWLAERGMTAFVLRYRLVDTGETAAEFDRFLAELAIANGDGTLFFDRLRAMLEREGIVQRAIQDGQEALRLVRDGAGEWGIDASRIGFMGFSAGAAVTIGVALAAEAGDRPEFVAPIYGAAPAHFLRPTGAFDARVVGADAPPAFLAIAGDDIVHLVDGTLDLFNAWRAAGVPVELHVYEQGGHGFGARRQGLPIDGWLERLGEWLEQRGHLGCTTT
jgi:acetyl esterase/lipase